VAVRIKPSSLGIVSKLLHGRSHAKHGPRLNRSGEQLASRSADLGVVIEAELTALSRGEECSGPIFVNGRHEDLDHPQPIERQPVSLSQRLAPQLAGNARRFQKGPDLLGLNLAICSEH
jgi:hypothetical protein